MKLSVNDLNVFVNTPKDIAKLCEDLSRLGLEVESCVSCVAPKNVVVGKVLEKAPHKNAEKLSVCQVDVGKGVLQIVCGAKNVAPNQFAPVALNGALIGSTTIAKTELRGVESCGMICSSSELGFPKINDGILELDESVGELVLGKELNEYAPFNTHVLEISLTPNRGDCLSVLGVAREISAFYNTPLKPIKALNFTPKSDLITLSVGENIESHLAYYLVCNHSLKTPLNVKLSLAHNNALSENDLKNFIEFSAHFSGVILNAYSLNIIPMDLSVKNDENNLESVYINHQKRSTIAIKHQDQKDLSEHLLLEASYIDPISLSLKLHALKDKTLQKDNALIYRSARGSNPNLSDGLNFLSAHLKATILESKQTKHSLKDRTLKLQLEDITEILGLAVEKEKIQGILKSLGFKVSVKEPNSKPQILEIVAPNFRHDIKTIQDIAEEILRFVGIDNLVSKPLNCVSSKNSNPHYDTHRFFENLKHKALACGFKEVIHYVFYSKEKQQKLGFEVLEDPLELQNPITTDLNTLRTSLVCGLLDASLRNKNLGFKSIALYEKGSVYNSKREEIQKLGFLVSGLQKKESYPDAKGKAWDFYSFAECVSKVIGDFSLEKLTIQTPINHPYQSAKIIQNHEIIGVIAKIHPKVIQELDLFESYYAEIDASKLKRPAMLLKPFSIYPSSVRDLTLIIDENTAFSKIKKALKDAQIPNLSEILPLDIFKESDNTIALSVRCVIHSLEKTLNDEEVNSAVQKALEILEKEFNARLKG
ncbi:phenylalanine--tRNA ligase subunit beta [Helicobacter pylori]|uniref:phenylalanine--tRNA ligase subunit beta n=1 Tax=Helicobacter pylori TaxID=210 RepID=UPI0009810234|nr:phenylalanine--tRNA ligase subunit beta [Helicobacter pylori]KAF0997960.1 phenylalanyl-tRNA synthetase subunit beta [Helicobacter pylori 10700]AQM65771.1 Phenylalanine--tRNA ligase beta subunit [Helicobacter pylori SS1]AQM72455.1 Phenylalanine--tRNA ligase beta subunit [Helicobacter pylori PMSS1]KAF0997034.1 phenylalanyl-tRNA synthetase subunit beta [Helicobacter pylori SS1_190]KAF0998944.1 phenylalanyl-tRNA synthetase subunit beta [Helicobacter pylori SS1]